MSEGTRLATSEQDGWALQSAEDRASAAPTTFLIPDRTMREALTRGDCVKLLFDIESRENDRFVHNVERMWVIVKERTDRYFVGVLTNKPATDHPTLGISGRVRAGARRRSRSATK
jgi:uncharacterized protein YegJ (DUF2314 family)